MFNIKYKGQFETEEQLQKVECAEGAQELNGSDSIQQSIAKGAIVSLPILLITTILAIYMITNKIMTDEVSLMQLVIVTLLVTFLLILAIPLHEVLHALWFPGKCEKEIWKATSEGAFFVHCTAKVGKKRYIILSMFPSVILGFLPLFLALLIYHIAPASIIVGLLVFAITNIYAGVSDYGLVYRILRQVPRKSVVYNSGMKTYWCTEERNHV